MLGHNGGTKKAELGRFAKLMQQINIKSVKSVLRVFYTPYCPTSCNVGTVGTFKKISVM